MSELEELRREVERLRADVDNQGRAFRHMLKSHERKLSLISIFLDLFSSQPWKPFSTRFRKWVEKESIKNENSEMKFHEEDISQ